jgi:hypothetical protein
MVANHTDYLLAELRCAALRARLARSDIEAVGVALKGGLISPDQAVELLNDCDALIYVEPTAPWRDPTGKILAPNTKAPAEESA